MTMIDYGKQQRQPKPVTLPNEVKPPLPPAREVEIFAQIGRHVLAIVYLLAELRLGYKPDKLKVKEQ